MIDVLDAEVRFPVDAGELVALAGVSCRVEPGHLVALVGDNGSGKTTLGRLMCGMGLPTSGRVLVDGHDPAASAAERGHVRRLVGLCQQSPEDQIVSSSVRDEVAFGPRNLGLDELQVDERVRWSLELVGLAGFEHRDTNALSGGEQQRLTLAGVLAMKPRYLVLDEPTSQLDVSARASFRSLVRSLADEEGVGIVLITHEPLEVLLSDEVLVLSDGTVAWEGAPLDLFTQEGHLWDEILLESSYVRALRTALAAGHRWSGGERLPEPEELSLWLAAHDGVSASDMWRNVDVPVDSEVDACRARGGRDGLVLEDVFLSFGDAPVLRGAGLDAAPGHVTLVSGPSGSGKSTLARVSAGLYAPDDGRVSLGGRAVRPAEVGLSFQSPERQFFQESVGDELAFAPRNLGCSGEEVERRVRRAADSVELSETLLSRDPFTLSGGQARRAAIASVLTLEVGAYVLDEPTAGLDARGRRLVHRLVRSLAREGAVIVVISHDVDEWLDVADEVALLASGTIVWHGSAASLATDAGAFEAAGLEAPLDVRLGAALERIRDGRDR